MCYRVSYLKKRAEKYAKHYGGSDQDIAMMKKQLDGFIENVGPVYQALAQDSVAPKVPVITNELPREVQMYNWGIVPHWASEHDDNLRRRFVVAQSEEMFNKRIYQESASSKRCLIMIDGYYDHHHRYGKTFPYYIKLKNDDPMMIAGIWSRWVDHKSEMELDTFAVLTTRGNQTMKSIHNNPEMLKRKHSEDARMPVIVPRELWKEWLNPGTLADPVEQKQLVETVCQPYPDELMESYTTASLNRGRELVNEPSVGERKEYPELSSEQLGLF